MTRYWAIVLILALATRSLLWAVSARGAGGIRRRVAGAFGLAVWVCWLSGILACDASGTSPPDSPPPDPQPTGSETATATDTGVVPDAGVPDALPAALDTQALAPDARPSPDNRPLAPDSRPTLPDARPLAPDARLADTAPACDLASRAKLPCVQYLPVTTWHCPCDMPCGLAITCLGGEVPAVWQQTVRGPAICACTRS